MDQNELRYEANECHCSVDEIIDACQKIGRYRKDVRWFIQSKTARMIDTEKGMLSIMAIFRNEEGDLESQFFLKLDEARIYLSSFVDKNKPKVVYNLYTEVYSLFKV